MTDEPINLSSISGINERVVTLESGLSMQLFEGGKGVPVVFLHGFPDLAWTWRYQIEALVSDFRVVAPNLRGYGKTTSPKHWREYSVEGHLVNDVVELLNNLEIEKAHLVAHDWGGSIAWHFAQCHPERLLSLSVVNCPHPYVFEKALRTWRQFKRSWYMKFFQIPGLPESRVSRDPQAFIQRVFRSKAFNEEAFSDANLSPMIHQVATFGLKGGINYYRARSRFPLKHDTHRFIETPTKLFWGVEDPFLHSSLADSKANAEYVAKLDIERIENAGHWSHWDLPERINDGLRRHWEAVAG